MACSFCCFYYVFARCQVVYLIILCLLFFLFVRITFVYCALNTGYYPNASSNLRQLIACSIRCAMLWAQSSAQLANTGQLRYFSHLNVRLVSFHLRSFMQCGVCVYEWASTAHWIFQLSLQQSSKAFLVDGTASPSPFPSTKSEDMHTVGEATIWRAMHLR